MNEATLQIYNATLFPPLQEATGADRNPFSNAEASPVNAALSREFSRLWLALLLTLVVGLGLSLAAVRSLSSVGEHSAHRSADVPTAIVASSSPARSTNQ